jgi:diaminohydroxyphosphoribosylaminopyrimidine deaminase/5-amino-6-(5-phosphoribosylamino)uracil reductase
MTSAEYLNCAYLLSKKANSKEIRPNPYVGAIIVNQLGEIIGEGYHKKAGEGHAEVNAIEDAKLKKTDLSDCTLYVTLEPCSHFGKTPPCTHLIIENKISKVVIGALDPNPKVSGVQILKEAGIEVEICIIPEIETLNSVFNINQTLKRPKYILKTATTVNGKIADRMGNSKWITNTSSRKQVHEILRTSVDAILTTAKTVIKDNAQLNIRKEGNEAVEINAVVIDRDLAVLNDSNKSLAIFYPREKSKIYIVTDKQYDQPLPAHVEIIKIEFNNGFFNITQLNNYLLEKNICEVLIEGGGKLNGSMINEKQVDEINLFIAPSLLIDNQAINAFSSESTQLIDQKTALKLIETKVYEEDVLLRYQVQY